MPHKQSLGSTILSLGPIIHFSKTSVQSRPPLGIDKFRVKIQERNMVGKKARAIKEKQTREQNMEENYERVNC